MELGDWIQIPVDTDPVTVRLMDEEARNNEEKEAQIRFAKQKVVSFGQVWINDIEGTLIATDDWFDSTHPRYAFVRDEDEEEDSYDLPFVVIFTTDEGFEMDRAMEIHLEAAIFVMTISPQQ